MIKISMKINDGIFECKINGHSEYAEYGKDIICASISTLYYFIINLKDKRHQLISNSTKSGNSAFKVAIDGNDIVIDTFIQMISEIAEEYPSNVSVKYDK